jgi:regulator of ribonuclease activity A
VLQEETLSKLKRLGHSLLGSFDLSLDNFDYSYWYCKRLVPSTEPKPLKDSYDDIIMLSGLSISVSATTRQFFSCNPSTFGGSFAAFHLPKLLFRSFRIMSSSPTSSSTTPLSSFKTTPDICDDYEATIRVMDPSLGFRNFGGKKHFGGQAVTVKCFEDNSCVKELAKSMDGRNKVMVVDGGGSRRRALLGDMVAADCVQQGWEGLVIYGSIRDVDEIGQLDLGVQALGTHPQKTEKRGEGQVNVSVTFGGVTIHPGNYIVCDNNGIVVNETDPRKESA